jgi:hypothetical protein
MDVIDLLLDHPSTPERPGLKAFLPDLMTILRLGKFEAPVYFHDLFRSFALQIPTELLYATISWVGDKVEVIWLQDIRDQFSRPLLIQFFELFEKNSTTSVFGKDRKSPVAITSYIVKGSGKVEV